MAQHALSPCPSCGRHVREDASACPFCQAALSPAPPRPTPAAAEYRAPTMYGLPPIRMDARPKYGGSPPFLRVGLSLIALGGVAYVVYLIVR